MIPQPVYRVTCRLCDAAALLPLFSLGDLCLCNTFPRAGDLELRVPLDLVLCDPGLGGCGLVQLRHTTPSDLMYREYWYRSGLSRTMRAHLASITRQAAELVGLRGGDVVLDIGCNDGTLLRSYGQKTLTLVGFEPTQLAAQARRGTSVIVHDYFNAEGFRRALGRLKAKVVTTIAMFYDIEDPTAFVADIRACLHREGVWIVEMHYLPAMLDANGYDAIVHEHVTYYSLSTLCAVLDRNGLEAFDVDLNQMNGGSFRVFIRHKGGPSGAPGARNRLAAMRDRERRARLTHPGTYGQFWRRVRRETDRLRVFVEREVSRGAVVDVYGASTKGNAILQFAQLGPDRIRRAVDITPQKWGRRTPGSHIPIVSPDQAEESYPDYFLVLIWHLLTESRQRVQAASQAGVRLLTPLPSFRIVRT